MQETTPRSDDDERRAQARRRAGTLVAFGVATVLVGFLVAIVGEGEPGVDDPATSAATERGSASLAPGTYRLPGLSTPVSITVPPGWSAGGSVWGDAGQGVAVLSTGRPSATISIALFDLDRLLPVDASGRSPDAAGDRRWFERSLDDYAERVEQRVRDSVVGRRLDWRPPPEMAWILTLTDRGTIGIADDVAYDEMPGDLVTFEFPGPSTPLFALPDGGMIELRPGITYTFWLPRTGRDRSTLMLGVARELGVPPSTTGWDVVRTLELGT